MFHFKTIHQILIIIWQKFSVIRKSTSVKIAICVTKRKAFFIIMLFTCIVVKYVWKDVSHILQCELKLEHFILFHNENYHSSIDNDLINCLFK